MQKIQDIKEFYSSSVTLTKKANDQLISQNEKVLIK